MFFGSFLKAFGFNYRLGCSFSTLLDKRQQVGIFYGGFKSIGFAGGF